MFVNSDALQAAAGRFHEQKPFDHCIIDDFFLPEVAERLAEEFPSFESSVWHSYNNAIEIKKTCNNWNVFPPLTYRVFDYLNSPAFCEQLSSLLEIRDLSSDPGLNGGGWHIHKSGGKLNTHLDYNIHPKLRLQRKLNIIVYLNRDWNPEWGGQLGLWEQSPDTRQPGALIKSVDPLFNRAVLFDTTQNSWHGLPTPINCPEGRTRNSMAVYYLAPAPAASEERGKALFAPTAEQEGNPEVLELIEKRAQTHLAASVYDSPGRE